MKALDAYFQDMNLLMQNFAFFINKINIEINIKVKSAVPDVVCYPVTKTNLSLRKGCWSHEGIAESEKNRVAAGGKCEGKVKSLRDSIKGSFKI